MSVSERVPRRPIGSALSSMASIGASVRRAGALDGATWAVERPKRPEHGDLATNAAMALAKKAGKPPRAIAEALVRGPRRERRRRLGGGRRARAS